jgi:CHAD domain-containing protein
MSATTPKSSRRSPPRSPPRDDIREALMVRKLGLKRLRRFTSLISKTMQTGKPKAVHDIRVASRRLQQILDYLYPPPRPPAVRRLRSRIRRSRRALSKVRDYDVFIASLESRFKSKQPAQQGVLPAIRERLRKRRAKLMKKAHGAFDKDDMPDLCAQLRNILSNPDQRSDANGSPPLLPQANYQHIDIVLSSLWRDFATEVAKSLRGPRPANMHRVRIKAKRLRYLLEVVEDLGNRQVDTHLRWLRRLQQSLGEWHDLEVQEQILLKMSSRRPASEGGVQSDPLIDMIRKMHAAKTDIERGYLKLVRMGGEWKRLRQWMKNHLAS